MDEVLTNIYSRRSVRSYHADPLSDDLIMEMVKAGLRAPNGMNVQALRFVIVTNKDRLDHFNVIAKNRFSAQLKLRMENAPQAADQLKPLKKMMDDPTFNIFYGAPCLILIFSAPSALTPVEDGALCAENMMLAAHSLGVGSCWIGFASTLGEDQAFLREVDVPADHKLVAQLIFGRPQETKGGPTPRKEPVIMKWVR